MKLCIDCRHYAVPLIEEAENKRIAKLSFFSPIKPIPKYPNHYYNHRCLRAVSLVTGKFLESDCIGERLTTSVRHCGPEGKFWEKLQ